MNEPKILYVSALVFVLLVIGLVLTVREFSRDRVRRQRGQKPGRGPVDPERVDVNG